MTMELKLLAVSIVLGFVHIVLASHAQSFQYGYRWTATSRDQSMPPLDGVSGWLERASRNFLRRFVLRRRRAHRSCGRQELGADVVGRQPVCLGPRRLPAALRVRRVPHPLIGVERFGDRHFSDPGRIVFLAWRHSNAYVSYRCWIAPKNHFFPKRSRAGLRSADGRRARINWNFWPKPARAARCC